MNLPNKKQLQKKFGSLIEINNVVFAIAIVIAVYFIWNTITAIEKNFALQTRVNNLAEEVDVLELQNENAELNNEYFKTDSYLELAARTSLGTVSPGEKVLVLPDYSGIAEGSDPAEEEVQRQEDFSNIDQWLYFLFRREPS